MNNVEDINENIGAVLFIMLGRIYDMLTLVADGLGRGEEALRLLALHQEGELMCPPPILNLEMNDENEHVENTNS